MLWHAVFVSARFAVRFTIVLPPRVDLAPRTRVPSPRVAHPAVKLPHIIFRLWRLSAARGSSSGASLVILCRVLLVRSSAFPITDPPVLVGVALFLVSQPHPHHLDALLGCLGCVRLLRAAVSGPFCSWRAVGFVCGRGVAGALARHIAGASEGPLPRGYGRRCLSPSHGLGRCLKGALLPLCTLFFWTLPLSLFSAPPVRLRRWSIRHCLLCCGLSPGIRAS